MSRIFMDGGSGINIIFADILHGMNILTTNLAPSVNTFHGIVPGRPVYSLGTITLEVIFGEPANFHEEKIEFEVVDWKSQYHVILGRPAYAKFMAVPHYAYLKLKMPGPNGTITVNGDFERSDECDRKFNKISESFGAQEQLQELVLTNGRTLFPEGNKTKPASAFNVTNDPRAHQVHPTDPKKTVLVSARLPPA